MAKGQLDAEKFGLYMQQQRVHRHTVLTPGKLEAHGYALKLTLHPSTDASRSKLACKLHYNYIRVVCFLFPAQKFWAHILNPLSNGMQ